MQINVHWGNLDRGLYASNLDHTLEKGLHKIGRLFNKIDSTTARIEFRLKYDAVHKRYKTVLYLVTPKSSYHITVWGFSFEESVMESIRDLRRKVRKTKEKKITLSRKKR